MDAPEAVSTHFVREWGEMHPPPGVEAYHDAILMFYIEWSRTGVIDPASSHLQDAAREAKALGMDFIEGMLRAGCIGE